MTDPFSEAVEASTGAFDEVLNRLGPPPADPTETWRATFAASGQSTSAQLATARAEAAELTRELLLAREALGEVQTDLNLMRADREALLLRNAELTAETADWRAQAQHWLTKSRDTADDLARANLENQRLNAELDSALRRLNEQREAK